MFVCVCVHVCARVLGHLLLHLITQTVCMCVCVGGGGTVYVGTLLHSFAHRASGVVLLGRYPLFFMPFMPYRYSTQAVLWCKVLCCKVYKSQ